MTARTHDIGASTRALHTSTELGQTLCRLALHGHRWLGRVDWSTAGDAWHALREMLPRPRGKGSIGYERADVETALELLAIRGLVSLEREEWRVTLARPQRYRWAKLATPEAMERFASTAHRCAYERCGRVMERRDVRFCNSKCASLKSHARRAK